MSIASFNLERIIKRVEAQASFVTASVVDHEQVTPTLVRATLVLSTLDAPRSDIFNALCKAVGQGAQPVLSSFRAIEGAYQPAVVGFFSANQVTRDFAEEGYRVMASNLMMDEGDNTLWEVQEVAGKKVLVSHKGTEESLSDLMVTASVRAPAPDSGVFGAEVGEFVTYVSALTNEVRSGFVLEADEDMDEGNRLIEVLPTDSQDDLLEQVASNQIVEVASLDGREKEVAEANGADFNGIDTNSKEGMKAFYAKVYGYGPAFLAELDKIIDSHATA